jgi:hypothetical protein
MQAFSSVRAEKKKKAFRSFFAFFCSNVRESLQLHSYGLHETRSILLSFFFARAFAFLLCGFFFALARCAYGLPVSGPMRVKLKRNTASEKAVRAKKKKKKEKQKSEREKKMQQTERERDGIESEKKMCERERKKASLKCGCFFFLVCALLREEKSQKSQPFFLSLFSFLLG